MPVLTIFDLTSIIRTEEDVIIWYQVICILNIDQIYICAVEIKCYDAQKRWKWYNCDNIDTLKSGAIFDNMKLLIKTINFLLYFWSINVTKLLINTILNIGEDTLSEFLMKFRSIWFIVIMKFGQKNWRETFVCRSQRSFESEEKIQLRHFGQFWKENMAKMNK